ncbi:hypothetical protein MLD38_014891 [Melastoma candidum]|uniref:Uncharacterized protein n=1 Tax=Melastoma candidum TaxID=119954 RepID=A0ACB9RHD0_9MYRT|nr:hypothetical protein MLD38_014891 [Melastoma candidum]
MVTDKTVGIAMGIPPISRTKRLLIPSLKRFTGESGLIDLQGITLEKASICRNDVTEFDTDNVSWDQNARILLAPSSVS